MVRFPTRFSPQVTAQSAASAPLKLIGRELPGSHSGLGVNVVAMWIIADRLAQAEGKWKPFHPSSAFERAFRRLDAVERVT